MKRFSLGMILSVAFSCLPGCAPREGFQIPLHDQITEEHEGDQAPVALSVHRLDGPSRIQVGDSWTLRASARDPEGEKVRYHWQATTGTLSSEAGQEVVFTADQPVGRAEITVEAMDPGGNAVQGTFALAVPFSQTRGVVEDVRDSVGYYCSLALDQSDRPHIAYHNATHPALKYAYHDGTQWRIELVEGFGLDVGGAAGYNASLALDASGKVHIAYLTEYMENEWTINYASKVNGQWVIASLDSAFEDGFFNVNIAINPVNKMPELIYVSQDGKELRHATCGGNCHLAASWNTGLVFTADGYSNARLYGGDLVIDESGQRQVSFSQRFEDANSYDRGEVFYAKNSGDGWDWLEEVSSEHAVSYYFYDGEPTRLALDRAGQPLVLHPLGVYHRHGEDDWTLSAVETGTIDSPDGGSNTARYDIACDTEHTPPDSGVVWLTSTHGAALELVKTNARGYFEYTYVGNIDERQARSSIALDSGGQAHLCWVNEGALQYQ